MAPRVGAVQYIIWSFVLLQFRGASAKPHFAEYAVAYRPVRDYLPSEKVLKRVPAPLRDGLKRSFAENNKSDDTFDLAKIAAPASSAVMPWIDVPAGEAGRVYLGLSPPGLSIDGRFAVVYVDWTAGNRVVGEWWLIEKKADRWQVRAKDRKMIY